MFFGLDRHDFSLARSRQALPAFLVLAVFCLLFATVFAFLLRSHLWDVEQDEASRLLTNYLNTHRILGSLSRALPLRDEDLLQGLVFVRISQGTEQLLLVADENLNAEMQRLLALPLLENRVWLEMELGNHLRVLTLVSLKINDKIIIQVAKNGQPSRDRYRRMLLYGGGLSLFGIILSWLLSISFVKKNLRPLRQAGNRIQDLLSGDSNLLVETGNGPELDALYRQLNRLVTHNRRLVTGMQQSLDSVAHDLRTPMTRLRSVAEYGLQTDDNDRLREALADCLEESERVLAMLKIMMSVAEAEAGTMRLQLEETNLVPQLEQVLVLYEYVAEEKKISLTLTPSPPVWALVDRMRISQVWANLVDNALKYGRPGGWVILSAVADHDNVVVTVQDNGIGISPSEQGKIWERLYRGDRSRSQPGLGLGLSYVRAVVQAHGGSVTMESDLQQGSRCIVTLPRAQVRAQEKSQIRGE